MGGVHECEEEGVAGERPWFIRARFFGSFFPVKKEHIQKQHTEKEIRYTNNIQNSPSNETTQILPPASRLEPYVRIGKL